MNDLRVPILALACLPLWTCSIMDAAPTPAFPESLNRGLVAIRQTNQTVFLSWRSFASDPHDLGFNLYRQSSPDSPATCLTDSLLTGANCFIDTTAPRTPTLQYYVSPANGLIPEQASPKTTVWEDGFLTIPLNLPGNYRPGDASVGDLDGDGSYELVVMLVSQPRDNSFAGPTAEPILDAYALDGSHLWRIHLGRNIREGEHYTQFMVYDLNADGRAEVACKTADGTVDGQGKLIGDPNVDWRNQDASSRLYGRILRGPEYLTVFDGQSGGALHTVNYLPSRDPIDGWGGIGGNGGNDSYGNRCDRFLACIAYLDNQQPSLVMCRGVYGRITLAAWDLTKGGLTNRWFFDSGISYPPFKDASPFSGMGGHSLSVGDVDSDGRDEIVYHAMTIDDDGTGLYSTGRRHGDAMYLSDFDPRRPGQEVFLITENEDATTRFQTPGVGLHDARTGAPIWTHSPGIDVPSGLIADIDPRHPGAEAWGGPGELRDVAGNKIGPRPRTTSWAIWWDGDRLRELYSNGTLLKWNWIEGTETALLDLPTERRGRRVPNLAGDILGDWREEIILPAPSGNALLIHSTTTPTKHRLPTLMHDRQYRLAMAWQNVVYNKPPYPSFYLGE